MESSLPTVWLAMVGFILLYYVVTDGFDLGVGLLSLVTSRVEDRILMMDTLHYIWHTNQTWLVVFGGLVFGAFPLFYSVLFSALYIPAVIMVLGLVLRGVAFEFHVHSRGRRIWAYHFGLGSLLAALGQGFLLGGLLGGLDMRDGRYIGGVWDWISPFSCLVALGVLFGYVMLGANYLILKTEGSFQDRSFRYSLVSSIMTLLTAVAVYLWITARYPHVAGKWLSSPDIYSAALFPFLAAIAFVMFFRGLRRRHERAPLR